MVNYFQCKKRENFCEYYEIDDILYCISGFKENCEFFGILISRFRQKYKFCCILIARSKGQSKKSKQRELVRCKMVFYSFFDYGDNKLNYSGISLSRTPKGPKSLSEIEKEK